MFCDAGEDDAHSCFIHSSSYPKNVYNSWMLYACRASFTLLQSRLCPEVSWLILILVAHVHWSSTFIMVWSKVTLKWVSALTNESTFILHFCCCMQNNCVLFNKKIIVEKLKLGTCSLCRLSTLQNNMVSFWKAYQMHLMVFTCTHSMLCNRPLSLY